MSHRLTSKLQICNNLPFIHMQLASYMHSKYGAHYHEGSKSSFYLGIYIYI